MGKFKDFMGGTGAGLLNEASKNLAKNNMEITYIPRDEIYKNPKNEYSISDIENLADFIYVMGLREPLGVKPEGSGYKLIEGERRLTAIDKLIADGKWEGDIPCIIREKELKVNLDILSDEEKEILEIAGTNAGQRKYSEADYLFEVEKLEPIYKKLKASGIGEFTYESDTGEKITQSLTGKKSRELLAERLNVSPAQVGKISKVANSGTEELKEAVKDGTANIAVAAEIAAMEKEDQKRLIEQHQKENGKAISKKDVEAFKNGKSLESNTYTYILDDKEFMKLTKKIRKLLKSEPKTMGQEEYMDVLKKIRSLEKLFS
ncbi:ParB/RepB/Spo0J family partition protein [[Ruminococcus] lactaris]|uniref:ParB/RepB/Spo0J family partition protein n=1 Tax=[Ruminococcus] lactaris TaxID=46228 RepID=UPI003FD6D919